MLPLVTGMGTLFWMVRKSGYPTRCIEPPLSPDTKTRVSSPGVLVVAEVVVGVVGSAVVDGPVVVIGLVVVTSLVVVGSAVVVGCTVVVC